MPYLCLSKRVLICSMWSLKLGPSKLHLHSPNPSFHKNLCPPWSCLSENQILRTNLSLLTSVIWAKRSGPSWQFIRSRQLRNFSPSILPVISTKDIFLLIPWFTSINYSCCQLVILLGVYVSRLWIHKPLKNIRNLKFEHLKQVLLIHY